jgi:hypothetical protein
MSVAAGVMFADIFTDNFPERAGIMHKNTAEAKLMFEAGNTGKMEKMVKTIGLTRTDVFVGMFTQLTSHNTRRKPHNTTSTAHIAQHPTYIAQRTTYIKHHTT